MHYHFTIQMKDILCYNTYLFKPNITELWIKESCNKHKIWKSISTVFKYWNQILMGYVCKNVLMMNNIPFKSQFSQLKGC